MKQFKPTSWAIDNRTSIYIITIIITLFGIYTYNALDKERFPEIVIPTISIVTVNAGTSPSDVENLITRPIEKRLKGISDVKKVTSNSRQDFSLISVEFNTNIAVEEAKQRVNDAVDQSRTDLPTDLTQEPMVKEINFSEIPIMFVHVSGDFEMDQLKNYAERLQDRIESLTEITRADMVGALDREVQIDVDLFKMQVAKLTFSDIERAVASENMTISGGSIDVGNMERTVRVMGEFRDPGKIGDIILRNVSGAPIYLRDIAEVKQDYEKRESYARLDGKPVISLNIIKRSGENLISASDNVRLIVEEMEEVFPQKLEITITGDQSTSTRNTLNDLMNTIIIGFILVTLVLMFFMGTVNAIFVGLSVPISTFLALLIMPTIGFTLNMIVLFALLLALGIVVDDAIVVIENTHRIYQNSKMSIVKAAKLAAGEVFIPVFAGTLTTLAPFVPLAFWPGIVGEFMFFLPITLILVLTASLIVAFFINPVFAVSFMKRDEDAEAARKGSSRTMWYWIIGIEALAIIFYVAGWFGVGNFLQFLILLIILNRYVFTGWIHAFQNRLLPAFMRGYERALRFLLRGSRPYWTMAFLVGLLVFSVVLIGIRSPKVGFFPSGEPNFIYTYISMPVGTDLDITDSITKNIEKRVVGVLGENNPDVESVIANVAVGAGDPTEFTTQAQSHKGKVTVAFKEFAERNGEVSTQAYLDEVREVVQGIPGAEIVVEKERNGPPTGKPISIEIAAEDYDQLIRVSRDVQRYLVEERNIGGIEELRSDVQDQNPEIVIDVDRERANREGISTAQVGMALRTAIFGSEASTFRLDEDEYPIMIRYNQYVRNDMDALMNLPITFRDISTGMVKQIPLSAVAKVHYGNSYGGIKRKDLKRVVTLSSNVTSDYNATEVNTEILAALDNYDFPEGFEYGQGGEQQEQQETASFLSMALILAGGLIFMILVTQFNSISKPFIILSEIIFSVIGVLLGFAITGMEISIVMTGVGIVALAGIVVKNGILLVEFTDELKNRRMRTLEAIVQAGKTRLSPVLLTATATILGLIPLAIGMNINFFTLFTEGKPDLYVGGESASFWGPLAWTIIFGLTFATFLTLLAVPVMYLINYKLKLGLRRKGILSRGIKEDNSAENGQYSEKKIQASLQHNYEETAF